MSTQRHAGMKAQLGMISAGIVKPALCVTVTVAMSGEALPKQHIGEGHHSKC